MRYIAALDFDHLDNGVFLNSFAQSLARHYNKDSVRPIIVHADSAYTDRIIQTGVMRGEATIRSAKDLNKRLVALFADEGVSTVGINPYQREFISLRGDSLEIDHDFLQGLPQRSVLLLSSLVLDRETNQPALVDLPKLVNFLYEELEVNECFIFSKSDKAEVFTNTDQPDTIRWKEMDEEFREEQIPDEFMDLPYPVRLTSGRDFAQIPDLNHTVLVPASEK